MVIKEGWIMEEIVTRSKDFGTVLIMNLLQGVEKETICSIFVFFFKFRS